jgi:hypothetical protein
LNFVAPRMTATAPYIIATSNDIARTCWTERRAGVTDRTRPDFAIDILAGANLRLRIQPTLPAPFNLVDDVDGQGLSHGDPPCGGSIIRLSAIDCLLLVPMILSTWTLLVGTASTFGPATGPLSS